MSIKKIIVIVVGLAVVAGVWFWQDQRSVVTPTATPQPSPEASAGTATPTPTTTPAVSQYKDLIMVTRPEPGGYISSPVVVEGQARGTWYFEASFPITIVDWDGKIIGEGHAEAQTNWMTPDYVPFRGEITFTKPTYKDNGWIIFRKDNPSGLSQYDDAFEMPVLFR